MCIRDRPKVGLMIETKPTEIVTKQNKNKQIIIYVDDNSVKAVQKHY